MMAHRSLFLALALPLTLGFAALGVSAGQAPAEETLAAPVLRANVTVNSDLVLIGDVIENAGVAAKIAIFRAPDLGTTGALPTAKLLSALRAHRVIGVDTRDIREVMVTRVARTAGRPGDRERSAARAGAQQRPQRRCELQPEIRSRSADHAARSVQCRRDGAGRGAARCAQRPVRGQLRDRRRDRPAPTKLRFTGTAIETVEAAVLVRGLERNEVVKASDVVVERRPKAEVGDVLGRDGVIGMQARRSLRAGQPLRSADLGKPDLVQRDQGVTLTYEATGIYLTVRGKAMENGAEGDVVNVVNLQSKRTVSGIVIGRGQVSISAAQPRIVAASAQLAEPVPAAAPVARQPE